MLCQKTTKKGVSAIFFVVLLFLKNQKIIDI